MKKVDKRKNKLYITNIRTYQGRCPKLKGKGEFKMKGNVNYLELANSPLMWVSAAIAVGIVVFQSVLFFRKSLKAAKEIGIEQEKINMAIINWTPCQGHSKFFRSIG